jgi:uncharacterized protein YggU (UPF0235/DUF167 family)
LSWLLRDSDCWRLRIRLTPGARKDAILGVWTDQDGCVYLRISVRAKPEKGAANAALIQFLAKRSGIAKTNFSLVAGTTSRLKIVEVEASEVSGLSRLSEF